MLSTAFETNAEPQPVSFAPISKTGIISSNQKVFTISKTDKPKYKSVYQPVCFDWESFTTYHEFE